MSDYPNSDEEFELQYGDELELLNDHEDFNEPPVKIASITSRRSLDYGSTPNSTKANTQSDLFPSQSTENTTNRVNLDASFEKDFHLISDINSTEPVQVNEEIASATSTLNVISQNEPEPPRKRTIQELFGDIDDLLFENERKSKKTKPSTKYEEQLEIIEKIQELRRFKKENKNALYLQKSPKVSSEEGRNKANLSWRVPRFPFISITRHDKQKVYVRYHSDSYRQEDISREIKDMNFVGLMGDMFKQTWKNAHEIINKQLDSKRINTEEVSVDEEEEDQSLWVELYKPRRYLELLSDEATNKVLLKWIKLWDKVVFNRRPRIKPVQVEEKKPGQKFTLFNPYEDQLKLEEDGRPRFKVALLCGRPGLGKTTLAHVVAKHAGYNVIEINASDDRSLEFFRTSLENATQMRSVVDQEKRPNCIIFDEIDGAPSTSIDYLVKFVSGVAKGKKKGKNNVKILKRPIICICNDAYVPALRSLRQMAFVVNFPPTSSARLSERLMEIARRQHLVTDTGAMLSLAEKSKNDIRSCLGVLHFFKAQKKRITLTDIYRSNVGQKDMQEGLFSVWTDIFSIERAKTKFSGVEKIQNDDGTVEYDMSHKARMAKILRVVQSFGDYERLTQGVFENFPDMNIREASMLGTTHALDWFCYSDKLNQYIMAHQNFSLSTYLPYAFVVWHFQFSSLIWPKITYPNRGYEVRTESNKNLAILKELMKGTPPKTKVFVNTKNLILDILPALTRIISPPLRPVNLHLFTAEEKQMLSAIVDVMVDYNLCYTQEKTLEGLYEFKLDPDVLTMVTFPNLTSQNRRQLSYFNKQVISREIEMARIRKFQLPSTESEKSENNDKKRKQMSPLTSPNEERNLPNHLRKLKVKSLKKAPTEATKDFFGRVITSTNGDDHGTNNHESNNEIWFKYKEGYSNAVRKKIKISSLM